MDNLMCMYASPIPDNSKYKITKHVTELSSRKICHIFYIFQWMKRRVTEWEFKKCIDYTHIQHLYQWKISSMKETRRPTTWECLQCLIKRLITSVSLVNSWRALFSDTRVNNGFPLLMVGATFNGTSVHSIGYRCYDVIQISLLKENKPWQICCNTAIIWSRWFTTTT